MKTCIIVDDDFIALKIIKRYISTRTDIICANVFVDPIKAIDYLESNDIDIAFLDIEMPNLTGLELASKISKSCAIIFTTAMINFAIDAFNVSAIDYLLKPVSPERFDKAVTKALEWLAIKNMNITTVSAQQKCTITIKSGKQVIKVNTNDIKFIESKSEYIVFNTIAEKIISLGALKDLVHQLPTDKFLRLHRSHIVNINFIISYDTYNIYLENNIKLTIGNMYRKEILNHLKNIWEKKQ